MTRYRKEMIMNIGMWLGVILSFVLVLIMLIITSTPGITLDPLMLIFDIITFVGWGVFVGYTIYALILSGRALEESSTSLTRKILAIWLWCFIAIATVLFLAAFAGFTGQWIMIIAASLSVAGWGFFIGRSSLVKTMHFSARL